MLRRYEEADKAIRVAPPRPLPRSDVDVLQAREKAARAEIAEVSREIDAISARISGLRIEQRQRERSPWLRFLPDRETGAVIAGLEQHRDRLRSRQAILAQRRLRAEVEGTTASRAWLVAQAQADQERQASVRVAERRLAIISRARRLIAHVPALAYIGAKRLLALALRIEKTREQGWDPGPHQGSGLSVK